MRGTEMRNDLRRTAAFTLIEVMIVVAVIGAFVGIAAFAMRDAFGNSAAKSGARSVADLLMLARTEAIRTGDNHVVFFEMDAQDNPLTGPNGSGAVALLIRDADADGRVDTGEAVDAIYMQQVRTGIGWGSAFASLTNAQAPNDNPGATFPESDTDFICCSFLEPDADPARWVVYLPDGLPRAFSIGPFTTGPVASGNGAVYVTSGSRDYAVVLAPLGGVRVHAWGETAWTQ
jgi:prepilin-type N-terminal cleavage/methylation domain-containing protein